ncbi:MAG: hypothetical protein ABIC19_00990 [Patescibacteria group bacterium]|nr:hypothetical protein [Patescibacteria group bacterium]
MSKEKSPEFHPPHKFLETKGTAPAATSPNKDQEKAQEQESKPEAPPKPEPEKEQLSMSEILNNKETKDVLIQLIAKKEKEERKETDPQTEFSLISRIIRGEIEPEDYEKIREFHQQAQKINARVKFILGVFKRDNGKVLEQALASSPEFEKIKKDIPQEHIKELFGDRNFYLNLGINQPQRLKDIESELLELSQINQKSQKLDEVIAAFAKPYHIDPKSIQRVLEIYAKYPFARDTAIQNLILDYYEPDYSILGLKASTKGLEAKRQKVFQRFQTDVLSAIHALAADSQEQHKKIGDHLDYVIKEDFQQDPRDSFQERIVKTMLKGRAIFSLELSGVEKAGKILTDQNKQEFQEKFRKYVFDKLSQKAKDYYESENNRECLLAFGQRKLHPLVWQEKIKDYWNHVLTPDEKGIYQEEFTGRKFSQIMQANQSDHVSWLVRMFFYDWSREI